MTEERGRTFDRDTMGDDLIDRQRKTDKDSLKFISKKARKFLQLLEAKYGLLNLSRADLIKKARKHARKYQLTDDEFDTFVKILLSEKKMPSPSFTFPDTPLSRLLGQDATMVTWTSAMGSTKMNVKPEDVATVREIADVLYQQSKPLHSNVVMQSLMYKDSAPEALAGKFDQSKHNVYSHIHPIIAALFIPKIRILEEHILLSNIGYIVKSKYEGTPIMTKPDFELYWSMITDPNDSVCSIDDPIKDLKNRYELQIKLWEDVLNLRQGRYYYSSMDQMVKFMRALENCRPNIFDAADLTYVKDEGSILRRILSAFSIRPTLVSSTRLWASPTGMGMGFGMGMGGMGAMGMRNPMQLAGSTKITQIPMVVLRLPLNISGLGSGLTFASGLVPGMETTTSSSSAVSLKDALVQPEWFIENKTLVPKTKQVLFSKDVLFFYVNRRYQTANVSFGSGISPCNFTSFPMTISGWEQLNDYPVDAPCVLEIGGDTYELRSVVTVESTKKQNKNVIVGSSAMIRIPRDIMKDKIEEVNLVYDPQNAGILTKEPGSEMYTPWTPFYEIPGECSLYPGSDEVTPFSVKSRKNGTIYVYVKISTGVDCIPVTY